MQMCLEPHQYQLLLNPEVDGGDICTCSLLMGKKLPGTRDAYASQVPAAAVASAGVSGLLSLSYL